MHGRTGIAASGSRGLANQQSHVGIWGVPSMGVITYQWMVYFMENPFING
jgi:hypothetical protein